MVERLRTSYMGEAGMGQKPLLKGDWATQFERVLSL